MKRKKLGGKGEKARLTKAANGLKSGRKEAEPVHWWGTIKIKRTLT